MSIRTNNTIIVRCAIITTLTAGPGVTRPLTRRVNDAIGFRFKVHEQLAARATNKLPIATGIRPIFVSLEEEWKPRLGNLNRTELQAASRMPLSGGLPSRRAKWGRVRRCTLALPRPGGGS